MKKLYNFLLIALAVFILGCQAAEIGPDQSIVGEWADANVRYTFNQNLTYSKKYMRRNTQQETLEADYLFGDYFVDNKRNNISFELNGYTTRSTGDTVRVNYTSETWHYTVTDSVLTYTSKTSMGKLYRIK